MTSEDPHERGDDDPDTRQLFARLAGLRAREAPHARAALLRRAEREARAAAVGGGGTERIMDCALSGEIGATPLFHALHSQTRDYRDCGGQYSPPRAPAAPQQQRQQQQRRPASAGGGARSIATATGEATSLPMPLNSSNGGGGNGGQQGRWRDSHSLFAPAPAGPPSRPPARALTPQQARARSAAAARADVAAQLARPSAVATNAVNTAVNAANSARAASAARGGVGQLADVFPHRERAVAALARTAAPRGNAQARAVADALVDAGKPGAPSFIYSR